MDFANFAVFAMIDQVVLLRQYRHMQYNTLRYGEMTGVFSYPPVSFP